NTVTDLLDRLNNLSYARPGIEHGPAAAATAAWPAASSPGSRRARAPPLRSAARNGCSRTAGARQDAAVDTIDAIAGFHRRRRALFQSHRRRFFRRDEPLRKARSRVELDVLARLASEQLIERHVQGLALDVPQGEVDGAER